MHRVDHQGFHHILNEQLPEMSLVRWLQFEMYCMSYVKLNESSMFPTLHRRPYCPRNSRNHISRQSHTMSIHMRTL